MEIQSGTVEANGLTFSTLELGEGEPVLALHGFPDHARSYRHQMSALAEAGYRVVAPFMRGYAPSELPSDGLYGVQMLGLDAAAMVEALCHRHGVDQMVLIGHDWGAAAAYNAAARVPDRLRKLVTLAVPYGNGLAQAFVTDPEQQRRSWYMFFFQMPFAEMAVAHDDYRFIRRLWQDWSPGYALPEEEWVSLRETLARPGVLTAALSYYRDTLDPTPEAAAALSELDPESPLIRVPTLYLHGRDDGCIGASVAEGMDALFEAGLERVVLDDVGHFLHQEDPERVNRLLLEFLG